MQNEPIQIITWHRCDPLEPFSLKLQKKACKLLRCKLKPGGGSFTVFAAGAEQSHNADLSLVPARDSSKAPFVQRVKNLFRWVFNPAKGRPFLLMRRDPDPSCLAESYALYIRINDAPELERVALDVAEEFKDLFKDGVFIYSEFSQPGTTEPG